MSNVFKPTPEQLRVILDENAKWRDGTGGKRANLTGADLTEANLYEANLYGANLYGANLTGADLTGADLYGANLYGAILYGANLIGANLYGADLTRAILPEGITWEQYLADVVPALLTAGGRTIDEVIAAGAWDCHDWTNCPMHAAFGIESESQAPALLRPRVSEFVRYFDARLIPKPRQLPGGAWTCKPGPAAAT